MPTEIFLSAILSAMMTFVGSLWIDRLYRTCEELTFPEKIFERSKFRRPILFCSLTILLCMTDDLWLKAAIFFLALMTATDFEQYMLFDAMTVPFALIGAFRIWQTGLNVTDHAAAFAIGGGIFFLMAVLSKGALGGGDVKLVAALGLWLGCEKLLSAVIIATIGGGVAAVTMILLKQKDRGSYFAYGPYFAIAAIYILLTS